MGSKIFLSIKILKRIAIWVAWAIAAITAIIFFLLIVIVASLTYDSYLPEPECDILDPIKVRFGEYDLSLPAKLHPRFSFKDSNQELRTIREPEANSSLNRTFYCRPDDDKIAEVTWLSFDKVTLQDYEVWGGRFNDYGYINHLSFNFLVNYEEEYHRKLSHGKDMAKRDFYGNPVFLSDCDLPDEICTIDTRFKINDTVISMQSRLKASPPLPPDLINLLIGRFETFATDHIGFEKQK